MNSFTCRRCGASFSREAHLIRHLEKKVVCPPTKSLLDRTYLIKEQIRSTQKKYPCGFCSKSFIHESNKYRHRKTCTAYQTQRRYLESQKDQDVQIAAMKKEMEKLAKGMEALLEAKSAAPAPTTNLVNGSMAIGGNVNHNNNTMNVYPIAPWDPEHIDFTPLREDYVMAAYEKAFVSNSPVETLMYLHMGLKPPRNHFVYMPSDKLEDARFFDGTSYKRVEDPRAEFKKGYDVYHRELLGFMDARESDLRQGCYYADADFDAKRESLLAAADKANCAEAVAARLSRRATEVRRQAIAPHSIVVE